MVSGNLWCQACLSAILLFYSILKNYTPPLLLNVKQKNRPISTLLTEAAFIHPP
jgi:hypothetical protein